MGTPKERGQSPHEPNFILSANELSSSIEEKYKERHPREEARRDAIVYSISELASFTYTRFFPPEGEDLDTYIPHTDREIDIWQDALNRARQGGWEGIKSAIQDDAQSAFTAAAAVESWQGGSQNSAASNQRGQALMNFANSI